MKPAFIALAGACLTVAGCAADGGIDITESTPESRAAALQARCAMLDNELVQAQVNAIGGLAVQGIRARRQQACQFANLSYMLLYGIVPIDPLAVPPPVPGVEPAVVPDPAAAPVADVAPAPLAEPAPDIPTDG